MGANAQTTVPTFTSGQVLTADQQNQSARTGVPVFATTVTRDAAFGGTGEKTLAEGQLCYIEATNKRLQIYNGTAWVDFEIAGTSFTPSFSGYTRGNGTTSSAYQVVGGFVFVMVQEILGSTSSVTSDIILTLPVGTRLPSSSFTSLGVGNLFDIGTATYTGEVFSLATNNAYLVAVNSGGTYATTAGVTSTVPFTWTTGDVFTMTFNYRLA